MNPESLIPTPDTIPVAYMWLKIFLLGGFSIHILLVNVLLGGCIIAALGHLHRGLMVPREMEKEMAERLTLVMALAINFGVVPFLFLQVLYGPFIYVSSQLMAVYWLMVVLLLLVVYYSAYHYQYRFDAVRPSRRSVVTAMALLMLLIAFIFSNNMTLMLKPETWLRYFENPEGTLLNIGDPIFWPRLMHFIVASVAVAGLLMAVRGRLKSSTARVEAQSQIRFGLNYFIYATLIQVVIGCWFLMRLPGPLMHLFMGGHSFYTVLFVLGLALTAFSLLSAFLRYVWPTVGLVLPLIFSMVMIRDVVRMEYLKPYFQLHDLVVEPQYAPLVIFITALVGGLIVMGYVFRISRYAQMADSKNF